MADDNKQLNLPAREEKILEMWERENIFEKSLRKNLSKSSRLKAKSFVFYEGPPTANAMPGIHHVEARAFKDLIPRYKTMRGFFVARKAGWDTHGLPVELAVEKELGLKHKKDIEKFGIAEFNEKCRESVWKYKAEWEKLTKRIGYWLDMEHPYVTYDSQYMETVWWAIKEIWKKGLLYKDFKVVPWCPRCETGLSSHELGQPGAYQTVKENSVFVKLRLVDSIGHGEGKDNEYLLVWTTTPWTLPANVAVALNPKIEYTKWRVRRRGKEFYVWSATTPPREVGEEVTDIEKASGKVFLGAKYHPLFSLESRYSRNPEYRMGQEKDFYTVISGDFVSTEDGTGMVHIAPAFGDDDMNVVKKTWGEDYPILFTVSSDGTMKEGVIGEGKFAKDADAEIVVWLKKADRNLYAVKSYEHEYPHCWRCATPLLYFARDAWWIRMSELRGELLKQNKTINWIPAHLQNGRFGEFLKEARDWAFSRERYWGTPLPVWECKKCEHKEVVGSLEEFDALAKKSGNEYFLMRHGESETQLLWITDDDVNTYHLTDRGRKQVAATAKKLQKEKIDLIITSDVLRTRETAKIVGDALGIKDVIVDPRIREIHVGIFEHKSPDEYHRYYSSLLEKFTKQPPDGESLNDLKKRVMEALLDLEAKYKNKKILIISHEYPIWILWGAAQGMSNEEMAVQKEKKGYDFVKTAEVLALSLKNLPYDERGEVNLHRPYADDAVLECPKCGAEMKRVSEVADVWFDSGAMPFAQAHFPFEKENGEYRNIDISKFPKIAQRFWYPADFISEAIDQTRGWFYTLLAVGTLLGNGTPYKNVISLGHVLDKNGQKMSKSKGNAVDPWLMIDKYGADVIRWYFYTINHPGDPKLFDEKDLLLKQRGFFGTLWNCFQLFNTYVDKIPNHKFQIINKSKITKSKNILDVWVLTKLGVCADEVTKNLDAYEIMNAARLIEEFVINDFSQWFLRRSRRRFQKPETAQEKKEAAETTAYVLITLAKLIAPFAPFFAEILWQELREKCGLKPSSVHLEAWPAANYKLQTTSYKLLDDMKTVREVVAEALKLRAEAGIKVRQPLAKIQIPNSKFQINSKIQMSNDFLDLLRDELNVKEVAWGDALKLDTIITPELREEGTVREFVRAVQEMRKDAGFEPQQIIRCQVAGDRAMETILEKWQAIIKKEINAKELKIGGKKKFQIERDVVMDGQKIWIGLAPFRNLRARSRS